MPEARTTVKRAAIVIVVLLLIAAGLLYARKKSAPQEIVLSGTLEARTVNVGSLVGGRVANVLTDEGQAVTPGQVIVRLETDTIDRQIAEQHAVIDSAKAQLAKGIAGPRSEEISKAAAVAQNDEKERQRMSSLHHAGIVSREMLDAATTKAKTSADDLKLLEKGTRPEDIAALRADVERQQRRLDELMKQRAECDVQSSVGGVVQSFGLRPGDLVAPNQTVAEILEQSQLWVRVYVPETELGLVHVDQTVNIRVDTFPNRAFAGHVSTISERGEYTPRNVQTRAQRAEQVFAVKVRVDPNPSLKAGMAAEVDLGVKGKAD